MRWWTRSARLTKRVSRVSYEFDFAAVFAAWPELLQGMLNSLVLSALAMVIGMVVAVGGALGKTSGPRPLRLMIDGYIELIRNTPFLVQIFLIYFGLPALGIRLSSNMAALLALVVNVGAYGIEIVRAGIESIQKGQIEAGKSLGMRPLQIFRYIILKPAIQAIYPSLTSQFILLMLNSSVCSAIAASELTAVAGDIQSRTFRSFEVYFVVTCMYLAMSVLFWTVFAATERVFLRKATRYGDARTRTKRDPLHPDGRGLDIASLHHRLSRRCHGGRACCSGPDQRVQMDEAHGYWLHQNLSGHASTDAALSRFLRARAVRLVGRSLDGGGAGLVAPCQCFPRRNLARRHRERATRPMGGSCLAWPAL